MLTIELTEEQSSKLLNLLYAQNQLSEADTVDLILALNNAMNAQVALRFGLTPQTEPADQARVRASILQTYRDYQEGQLPKSSGLF